MTPSANGLLQGDCTASLIIVPSVDFNIEGIPVRVKGLVVFEISTKFTLKMNWSKISTSYCAAGHIKINLYLQFVAGILDVPGVNGNGFNAICQGLFDPLFKSVMGGISGIISFFGGEPPDMAEHLCTFISDTIPSLKKLKTKNVELSSKVNLYKYEKGIYCGDECKKSG